MGCFACVAKPEKKGTTLVTTAARKAEQPSRSGPKAVAAKSAIKTVLASLDDSKAEDIVSIDIEGKSALADYMVVTSGRSSRHVAAIAEHLMQALKDHGFGNVRVEGLQAADWVLIDADDVIIHVFRPEVRSFYNIEKMWQAPDIDATRH